ncbi:Scr1 family TA system antitoxin-like transcriptional regulator [Kitasatospora sp. NPDC057518]|uniref:Scr1 family TA system antitoxin-like transcriptional regulator n=1 Tax=unclassified Kitasatospora TaxID=2633591 RepID=UPI003696F479
MSVEWQGSRSQRQLGANEKQDELAALERGTSEFRYFLPTMVTGLLAVPEYIEASLASLPGDHSKVIAAKLGRQAVLHDTTKHFTFLLTEQACLWPLLPVGAMAMQLDHLVSVSRLPNVRLGVIPMAGHMPRGPLNVFTIYDSALVTVEVVTGMLAFRESQDVEDYLKEFRSFEGCALWGGDARDRLAEWGDRYRQ